MPRHLSGSRLMCFHTRAWLIAPTQFAQIVNRLYFRTTNIGGIRSIWTAYAMCVSRSRRAKRVKTLTRPSGHLGSFVSAISAFFCSRPSCCPWATLLSVLLTVPSL